MAIFRRGGLMPLITRFWAVEAKQEPFLKIVFCRAMARRCLFSSSFTIPSGVCRVEVGIFCPHPDGVFGNPWGCLGSMRTGDCVYVPAESVTEVTHFRVWSGTQGNAQGPGPAYGASHSRPACFISCVWALPIARKSPAHGARERSQSRANRALNRALWMRGVRCRRPAPRVCARSS